MAGAGYVNGDGFDDVIVGAPRFYSGEAGEGAAFIYPGTFLGLFPIPFWSLELNQAGARFGSSVAGAGDINGDGCDEMIVGAPYYDNGETSEGAVFVYDLGSSLILYVSRNGQSGGHTPCYETVAQAYSSALDTQEIRLKADFYPEDLILDRPVGIIFSGGWNLEFSSNSVGQSIITGSLTISNGSLSVNGEIVIE